MALMRTAAVLPVKRFSAAKQRLGGSVAADLRMALAAAMAADVLVAVAECARIERTIVVTSETAVAQEALELEALVVADRLESGQSPAVAEGIARALAEGFERVLCIPGDCPTLAPGEVDELLSRSERGAEEVVIVPDRHGKGTNGLLLCPPGAIAPSFGEGSCERHSGLAAQAGLRWRIERPSSLLLDIDTRGDLSELRRRLGGARQGAARTRAVLGLPSSASRAGDAVAG